MSLEVLIDLGELWDVRRALANRGDDKERVLNLFMHNEESLHLDDIYCLLQLYPGEYELKGGRFKNYNPHCRTNRITMKMRRTPLRGRRIGDADFTKWIDWLGEKGKSPWSLAFHTVQDIDPLHMGRHTITAHFYFEDVNEAVLFLLSF